MTDARRGAQVLLTGVTGFVGKVVLEELFRRRQELNVETVYVLIRQRKDSSAEVRFREEVVSSECFSALPLNWEKFVKVLASDLTDLQLDQATRQEIHQNVSHVIHCAASVAFDLPVKDAAEANITSALNLLELARGCEHLTAFVDVSTAYVTPHSGGDQVIPEALVPLPMPAEDVYKGILDGSLTEQQLLSQLGHPNTYTLTKCLSEHLLNQRKGEIPLSIVRPSIIAASWQYPRPGWIDSYAAFAGFVGLIGAGLLKCTNALDETVLDIVPCDEVSHRIIQTAFATSRPPLVQHCVTGVDRGSRVDTCIAGIESYFQRHPVQFWPEIHRISNGSSIEMVHWRHHKMPAMVASTWFGLTGKHRQKRQIQKVLSRIEYVNNAFVYFTHHTFRFAVATPMAIPEFETKQYIERVCRGVHTNLMRANPAETLLGGSEHRHPKSDLKWATEQPRGNWAIRTGAYMVRKGLRRSNDRITFDRGSFEQALAQVAPETLLLLVPSHRSYMDFLLCSYMVFAHPELNISIPRIAAASDFAKLPLLGWFFQKSHAFYIQRGVGKADPVLTSKIQELVEQNASLEFFVEGTRSRSRQFLTPKRGMLRAIQSTGVSCTLLPIAISYDLVPEERSFLSELRGAGNSRMQMSTLFKWLSRLMAGEIKLGRVHLTCGQPLVMNPDTDVHALSRAIMGELQDKTAVSTLHLQAFLHTHPMPGIDLEWLKAAIEARGGEVIESPLQDSKDLDPITERSMRFHWMHYFYPDALALFPEHPVVQRHVQENAFVPHWSEPSAQDPRQDQSLCTLLKVLFAPIAADYLHVLDQALQRGRLPAQARSLVAAHPGSFMPVIEEALRDLQDRQLMTPDAAGKELIPGPHWNQLEAFRTACHWHEDCMQKARYAR